VKREYNERKPPKGMENASERRKRVYAGCNDERFFEMMRVKYWPEYKAHQEKESKKDAI
tara:strand:+ start:77596 stop:77772 length:177 start_codon:yes stop_codon:yes gene_type:complete